MHTMTPDADDSYSYTLEVLQKQLFPALGWCFDYLKASAFYLPLANVIVLIFMYSPVYIIWVLTLLFKSLPAFQIGVIQTLMQITE